MKEDIERRRMEAAERMKSLSTSSVDGDESFSPFSSKTPTHKVKTALQKDLIGWSMPVLQFMSIIVSFQYVPVKSNCVLFSQLNGSVPDCKLHVHVWLQH